MAQFVKLCPTCQLKRRSVTGKSKADPKPIITSQFLERVQVNEKILYSDFFFSIKISMLFLAFLTELDWAMPKLVELSTAYYRLSGVPLIFMRIV